MFIAERFLSNLVKDYGNHPVSTDGGTWYPQACEFLKMDHHIHSSLEKSLIERKMQYIKDRTEIFDDYFPCRKQNCKLEHIIQWIKVFAYHHNNNIVQSLTLQSRPTEYRQMILQWKVGYLPYLLKYVFLCLFCSCPWWDYFQSSPPKDDFMDIESNDCQVQLIPASLS